MEERDFKRIIKETVKETLVGLGIDACDPMEMQQDLHFLRNLRGTFEKIGKKALMTVVGVLVVAALGALWVGMKIGH